MTQKQFHLRKLNYLLNAIMLSLMMTSTTLAQPPDGYTSLFMGHSFFRPVADGLAVHPAQAGIVGHSQTVFSAGGCNGAPLSLWNNPGKSADIKDELDTGNVALFGMTYHSCAPTTEGYELWFDYALSKNPDTVFFIALPWPDFPEQNYADAAAYAEFWESSYDPQWLPFIDSLRAIYPDQEIFSIPYGQAAIELYKLFEEGNLPDVSSLTGDYNDAVFTDAKGHPGRILVDTCELIWLNAIYGVELDTYDHDPGYITDIKAIARDIMDAHNPDYNGPLRRPSEGLWDYTNVSYGPESRQWMNIALPDTAEPCGIYFWAHANGGNPFSMNPRSANAMLDNGFAVVSWGSVGQLQNWSDIQTAWADAQIVFDFVRANATIWNMDPDKIIIGGRSRGSIVSWQLAHSAHPAIEGIYMYNALPQAVWQNGGDVWVENVTEDSPPIYLVFGPPWGHEDGHRPDNVLPIEDRYNTLGIKDRFTLYQDMWGDFQDTDGHWTNEYRESHYFPELVSSLYGPVVSEVVLNIAEAQRSAVESLSITLDGDVEFQPGAFSVVQRSTATEETFEPVTINVNGQFDEGQTTVTIQFDSHIRNSENALVDGNYQVTLAADLITLNRIPMSEDFVFGDEEAEAFFSFYGDSNGDRTVNISDLRAFLKNNSFMDYDANGEIDRFDMHQFGTRLFETLPFKFRK